MKSVKKITAYILLVMLLASVLGGCKKKPEKVLDEGSTETEAEGSESETGEENTSEAETSEGIFPAAKITSTYDWIWDEVTYDEYYRMSADGIVIMNDGFDALQAALTEDAAGVILESDHLKDDVNEAVAAGSEYAVASMPWAYENRISIRRSDPEVFSYVREIYTNLGGAHPSMYYRGVNLETSTGKELTLDDFVLNRGQLVETIISTLYMEADVEGFFDGWIDTVESMYSDEPGDYQPNFVIEDEALRVIFNEYVLGPYALGTVEITIPYADLPNVFSPYVTMPQQYLCREITDYGDTCLEYRIDADNDGKEEIIQIDWEYTYFAEYDYSVMDSVSITYGREGALQTDVQEGYLEYETAYVMENENGRYYLYVEMSMENDYRNVLMYDLSKPDQGPIFLGEACVGAFYGSRPADPQHFYMTSVIQMLGTHSGYTECFIGEDGVIRPYSEVYTLFTLNYDGAFDSSVDIKEDTYEQLYLDVLQPVQGFHRQNIDAEKGEWEVLPAGSRVLPVATDKETYTTVLAEDGSVYDIYYDDPNDWERKINGVREYEIFGDLLYAG